MRYEKIMSIKGLARTGWMLRGVPLGISETVAEHTFEVTFLTMLITDALRKEGAPIDQDRALKIALIHDVPESISGDIVKWSKNLLASLSNRIDEEAMKELQMVQYMPLINEFTRCKSLEACMVKLADNLATALQAIRYVKIGYCGVKEIEDNAKRYVSELLRKEPLMEYAGILKDLVDRLIEEVMNASECQK